MSMKAVVIGANGQLGQDLVYELNKESFEVSPLTHNDIEITDFDSVKSALESISPDVVINTAAFHNVALCESDPQKAHSINVDGAHNVAKVSESIGATSAFISTDYVFAGDIPRGSYNKTTDSPAPLNVYGETKFLAEKAVLAIDQANLIFRISSVFGAAGSSGKGGNFLEAILRKISLGETAEVVNDSLMSPTYTRTASVILSKLIKTQSSGVHHGSAIGQCSWYDLASFAAHKVNKSHLVVPVESPEKSFPQRPKNSSLDTRGLVDVGISNQEWQQSVTDYLFEKGHLV